ncbi:MAG TPA: hypothetical protein VG269_13750 [Tepidisphaeraceae bacterium]|jgi:hypothetical protein|nr:hypothetical protein [Tepidisphaeraceae bacterium]
MAFQIETFYPAANLFLNTNHTSESLEELKALCDSNAFKGFRLRIVDDAKNVVFEPAPRERKGTPTIQDIANMLNIPVLDKYEPKD